LIQSSEDNNLEIICNNSTERFVIYNLCKLLNYKYKTIIKHTTRIIGCNEYLPNAGLSFSSCSIYGNTIDYICGCSRVPKGFWKTHVGYDYDGNIAYSIRPWSYKLGVKIFK